MDDEPQDLSLKPFAEMTEKELQAMRLFSSGASREEVEAVTGLSLKEPQFNPVTVANALARIKAALSDSGLRDPSHTTSVVADKDPTSETPPPSE